MAEFSDFAEKIYKAKYAQDLPDGGKEDWRQIAARVVTHVFSAVDAPNSLVQETRTAIEQRKILPGGRYLYASGRPVHQVNNCLLLRAEDSREGWADVLYKSAMALMTGAGIGIVYSGVREEGALIRGTGGLATGPIALMQIINEAGRGIMQGGSRRSAVWAGLHWNHPDILKFVHLKNWTKAVRDLKAKDFNFPATMDMTNISVILDDDFFAEYKAGESLATEVYWKTVERMVRTSEPGFSVDIGENAGEHNRNACTELVSRDDSDICNLISINMARVADLSEMRRIVDLATFFAIAGSVYSDVPYEKVAEVRDKNRRIGVGLMGLHEWLLQRGKAYGPDDDLEEYLSVYRDVTDASAIKWARTWGLSIPIKKRAIAPTGTIGIVAGPTTTGIEPMLCVAYLRRFLKGREWQEEYVIEPIAQRLIDQGMNPSQIEDAYTIDTERRLKFQAWVQQYVDHGISSTINLPAWGTPKNNKQTVKGYGDLFMKYLPKLRGLTCYADGSRSGQPLTPVPYEEAIKHIAKRETADICELSGHGGSCGS